MACCWTNCGDRYSGPSNSNGSRSPVVEDGLLSAEDNTGPGLGLAVTMPLPLGEEAGALLLLLVVVVVLVVLPGLVFLEDLALRAVVPVRAFRITCWLSSRNIKDSWSRYPGQTRLPLAHCEQVGRVWSHRILRDRHSPQPLLGLPQKTMSNGRRAGRARNAMWRYGLIGLNAA